MVPALGLVAGLPTKRRRAGSRSAVSRAGAAEGRAQRQRRRVVVTELDEPAAVGAPLPPPPSGRRQTGGSRHATPSASGVFAAPQHAQRVAPRRSPPPQAGISRSVQESAARRQARAARFSAEAAAAAASAPSPARKAFADAGPHGRWVVKNRDEALYKLLSRKLANGEALTPQQIRAAPSVGIVVPGSGGGPGGALAAGPAKRKKKEKKEKKEKKKKKADKEKKRRKSKA